MSSNESLEEFLDELKQEYQLESSETLGEDMQRYGEVQGALEAIKRVREQVSSITERDV